MYRGRDEELLFVLDNVTQKLELHTLGSEHSHEEADSSCAECVFFWEYGFRFFGGNFFCHSKIPVRQLVCSTKVRHEQSREQEILYGFHGNQFKMY